MRAASVALRVLQVEPGRAGNLGRARCAGSVRVCGCCPADEYDASSSRWASTPCSNGTISFGAVHHVQVGRPVRCAAAPPGRHPTEPENRVVAVRALRLVVILGAARRRRSSLRAALANSHADHGNTVSPLRSNADVETEPFRVRRNRSYLSSWRGSGRRSATSHPDPTRSTLRSRRSIRPRSRGPGPAEHPTGGETAVDPA